MDANQLCTSLSLLTRLFKYANWITLRNASRLTKTESSEQNSCVYFTDTQYELSKFENKENIIKI